MKFCYFAEQRTELQLQKFTEIQDKRTKTEILHLVIIEIHLAFIQKDTQMD